MTTTTTAIITTTTTTSMATSWNRVVFRRCWSKTHLISWHPDRNVFSSKTVNENSLFLVTVTVTKTIIFLKRQRNKHLYRLLNLGVSRFLPLIIICWCVLLIAAFWLLNTKMNLNVLRPKASDKIIKSNTAEINNNCNRWREVKKFTVYI